MRGPSALLIGFILAANMAAQRRLILIDQDGSGPGTNLISTMALLQARNVDVLGITIVTGDSWRDEEVQHTLRMLELIGRADVSVVPGAVFPLVLTEAETRLMFPLHGTPVWLGAWGHQNADVPAAAGSAVAAE